jgi:protein-ribulosamine 3-kinase
VDFAAIGAALSAAAGVVFERAPAHPVGGGCINECFMWRSRAGPTFVKLAAAARSSMFEAEADGLRALAACAAVRVPGVIAVGRSCESAFLALEWIETGETSRRSEELLGSQLAAQHRSTAGAFGWHRDNTIGLTPQVNRQTRDWVEFFREHRLRFQLGLAEKSFGSLLSARGARLLDVLPGLLDHDPEPSLLHGDLWGGNWFTDSGGSPVIFDPAVYHGDREADLAMSRLFGGFGEAFYRAYEASWPLKRGHEQRREIYNLYHVLNHANLFGGGYAQQAARMIDGLLSSSGR